MQSLLASARTTVLEDLILIYYVTLAARLAWIIELVDLEEEYESCSRLDQPTRMAND